MHDRERRRDPDSSPRAGLPHGVGMGVAGNRAMASVLGSRHVQRSGSGIPDALDGEVVSARIGDAESRGRDLDPMTRARVAEAIGADPGPVRVHADAEAHDLSRSLGAKAFTSGRDVFFGNGTFDPSTPEGFSLLVHESTHVLQQAAGAVAGTPTPDGALAISDPGDSFERAASSTAEGATQASSSAGDARSVQREEDGSP